MQHSEVEPVALRRAVVNDMNAFLAEYRLPESGTTYGTPWDKARVACELEKMHACLVDVPFCAEYICEDFDASTGKGKSERRSGFVVAEDGSYRLVFDYEAQDFVLVSGSETAGWGSFNIRGDAPTTFMAR